MRNTFYYVVGVVPLQTDPGARSLAVTVNNRFLKGRTFFRTAFYFPSVVSSVAISLVFLFLFTGTGAVNQFLGVFGIDGPSWFSDSRGLIHIVGDSVGLWSTTDPPNVQSWRTTTSWASPSGSGQWPVGCALGDHAAGRLDDRWHLHAHVPRSAPGRPHRGRRGGDGRRCDQVGAVPSRHGAAPPAHLLLVITLGIIGTWQVFDQMYVMTQGGPAKTTLTPAYLSYSTAFNGNNWGQGAAIAFLLFVLIFVLTTLQRIVLRDRRHNRESVACRGGRRAPSRRRCRVMTNSTHDTTRLVELELSEWTAQSDGHHLADDSRSSSTGVLIVLLD